MELHARLDLLGIPCAEYSNRNVEYKLLLANMKPGERNPAPIRVGVVMRICSLVWLCCLWWVGKHLQCIQFAKPGYTDEAIEGIPPCLSATMLWMLRFCGDFNRPS
jgi:hypothetical protein